jgi:hypothetical protein
MKKRTKAFLVVASLLVLAGIGAAASGIRGDFWLVLTRQPSRPTGTNVTGKDRFWVGDGTAPYTADHLFESDTSNNDHDLTGSFGSNQVAYGFVSGSVTGLTGSNNLQFNGTALSAIHIAGSSSTPGAPSAGTGCNTSSAITNAGNDLAGKMGVTCGGVGTASAAILTLTFVQTFAAAPICQLDGLNAATQALTTTKPFYAPTASTLVLTANTTGLPAGTYLWSYVCHGL